MRRENSVMAERALKSVPLSRDEAPDVRELPAVAPAEAPPEVQAEAAPAVEKKPRYDRRQRTRWGLFALLPVALIVGGYWYVAGGQVMSTDDAYVDAEKVGISTDVAGIVKDVDVKENQYVTTGQVLYHLDPRQFQIALENAKANLAQTALSIEAMKQDYKRMLSDTDAQAAQVNLDQTNYNRDLPLLKSGTISQAVFDQVQTTLETDKNKLESLRQQVQVQLARLDGNADIPVTQHPQYLQAQAQVDEAQRELDHATVVAPFAGTVTDVSSIAAGKYLAASMTAFYLVDTDHAWISANPKETELTYVRPGQPATVTVDTYPDLVWHGTVESVSPAAAEEFSLLPAQNTSGNWVKVVQRVPMRVRVDTSDPKRPPLRAGMSVEVDVNTGRARGFPHFLTALFGRS
jgi:membrane fusion protein, multidrug efflux system